VEGVAVGAADDGVEDMDKDDEALEPIHTRYKKILLNLNKFFLKRGCSDFQPSE